MIVSGISTFGGDVQVPDKIIHSGDTNTALRFPAADTVSIETAGSERVRITSDGDVGIGVNDPDAKLEVLEDVYVKGSSGDGSVGIQIRSGSSALSNQHQIRTGGGSGDQLFIEALGGSSAIVTKVAGSERLRIKSDGNVEIGGGTHSRRLAVHDTTNSVILIEGASNGTSNLMFGDENDEDVGMLGYNHGSNYLAFTVNAAERLRITSSGNIDINGTPPWSVSGGNYRNLSISGEGAGASGFIYLGNGGATTNADFDLGRINFCNGSTIVARVLATTDSSDNDEGRVSIYTKKTGISESEKLRIDSDGHVNVKLGNLVIGTSGKGIDFSATSNSDQTGSSMSSELLDDYEEGSWTPGNSDMGITNHYAYYTKVGRMVHIVMDITFASSPADSSQVGYVTQLPFDAGNFAQHVTVQWFGTSSVNDNNYYNTWMQTYIASGDDKLSILDARYGSYVTRATLAGKKLRANFWYVSS